MNHPNILFKAIVGFRQVLQEGIFGENDLSHKMRGIVLWVDLVSKKSKERNKFTILDEMGYKWVRVISGDGLNSLEGFLKFAKLFHLLKKFKIKVLDLEEGVSKSREAF